MMNFINFCLFVFLMGKIGTIRDTQLTYPRRTTESIQSEQRQSRRAANGNYIKAMKYVELYLVNDFSIYQFYNKNITYIDKRSKDIVKVLNQRFRQLRLKVILVGIETWATNDLITMTDGSKETLLAFMRYRENNINKHTRNDNAQLITKRHFDQSTYCLFRPL